MKAVSFRHHGRITRGDLSFPQRGTPPYPAVILVHGRGSGRRLGLIAAEPLRQKLLKQGNAVLRIDLFGHGQSDGDFQDLTITKAGQDVQAAVKYLQRRSKVDPFSIAAVGHSLGGSAILFARAHGARLKTFVLVAPVGDTKYHVRFEYSPAFRRAWKREKILMFTNRRGVTLSLRYSYYRDMAKIDLRSLSRDNHQPALIIHGTRDQSVPLEESRRLYQVLTAPKTLLIVPGADHNFRNPYHERRLFREITNWIGHYSTPRVSRSVVVFVKFRNQILALKRSDKVWYYRKKWGIVGGHLPHGVNPVQHGLAEVQEELGLRRKDLRVRRVGRTVRLDDHVNQKTWISVPILVELKRKPRIKLDWEHTAARWVEPKKFPFSQSYFGIHKHFEAVGLL